MIKVILNSGKVIEGNNVTLDNDKIIIERVPIVVSQNKISHIEVTRGNIVKTYVFKGEYLEAKENNTDENKN